MHRAVISFLYMGSSQFSARMHSSAWQAQILQAVSISLLSAHLTLVKRLGSLTDTAGETVGDKSLLQDLEFSSTIHSKLK